MLTDPPHAGTIKAAPVPGQNPGRRDKWLALGALLLLVPAPTLGVVLSMVLETTQGTMLGKVAYFLSKAWVLALPLVWILWIEKGKLSFSPMKKGGRGMGAALGLLISALVVGGYWLFAYQFIDGETVRVAAQSNGIGEKHLYLPFICYLTFVNSLLEEYVWRWFVFRQCEKLVGGTAAIFCSAAFFSIHHLVALQAQMGWMPTLLGTLGVFIGGAIWSRCYLKYQSVWPGYLSHIMVDLAIFGIGWTLIFP